ncbi:hypothetical protein PLICRDRAFT_35747 [Plicaturopsis crispa FD-325 SS-3]|nr:hypothetical protein PLICRDRAFT_35747 [Plicaturopsis crispa FD-325 SS-3]
MAAMSTSMATTTPTTPPRTPSPPLPVPGAWPDSETSQSPPATPPPEHIDRVISFHQRLSMSISSASLPRVPLLPLTSPINYKMPESALSSENSQMTGLGLHGASRADTSVSTAYTSESAPDVPTLAHPIPFSKMPVPLILTQMSPVQNASLPQVDNSPPSRRLRPSISVPDRASPSLSRSTTSPVSPDGIVFASPASSQFAFPTSPPVTPYSSSRSRPPSYDDLPNMPSPPRLRAARSDTDLDMSPPSTVAMHMTTRSRIRSSDTPPQLRRSNTDTGKSPPFLPSSPFFRQQGTDAQQLAVPVPVFSRTGTSCTNTSPQPTSQLRSSPKASNSSVTDLGPFPRSSGTSSHRQGAYSGTSAAQYAAAFRAGHVHPTAHARLDTASNHDAETPPDSPDGVPSWALESMSIRNRYVPPKLGLVGRVRKLGGHVRRVFGELAKPYDRGAKHASIAMRTHARRMSGMGGVSVEITSTVASDTEPPPVPAVDTSKRKPRRALTLHTFAPRARPDTHVHTQTQVMRPSTSAGARASNAAPRPTLVSEATPAATAFARTQPLHKTYPAIPDSRPSSFSFCDYRNDREESAVIRALTTDLPPPPQPHLEVPRRSSSAYPLCAAPDTLATPYAPDVRAVKRKQQKKNRRFSLSSITNLAHAHNPVRNSHRWERVRVGIEEGMDVGLGTEIYGGGEHGRRNPETEREMRLTNLRTALGLQAPGIDIRHMG